MRRLDGEPTLARRVIGLVDVGTIQPQHEAEREEGEAEADPPTIHPEQAATDAGYTVRGYLQLVPPEELKEVQGLLGKGKLRPGLPVQVVLSTRKRTALQYILEPLTNHLWGALREQ